MKFINLLVLMLLIGLAAPGLQAQRAGFAVGIHPAINSPVQPMMHSPVQPFVQPPVPGKGPHFGVTPPIVPPIISTFPPISNFPSQVPHNPLSQGPMSIGPHGAGGQHRGGYGAPYGGGYGPPYNSGYGQPYGGDLY